MSAASDSKWWGWGEPGERRPSWTRGAGDAARAARRAAAVAAGALEPVDFAAAAAELARPELVDAVGGRACSTGDEDRVRHAAGRGYPDLARLRAGSSSGARRGRSCPPTPSRSRAVLDACADARASPSCPSAAAPASSAGVEPLRGAHARADQPRPGARCATSRSTARSLTATLGAGPARPGGRGGAGRARARRSGHFPQSFEYATIGGFAATRSAGQASSGYGRFDELVTRVALIAPRRASCARWRRRTPPPAPRCASWSLGSEGVLGVITDVTVRVRPAPRRARYEAWIAGDFDAGAEIVRALAQGDRPARRDPRSPTRRRRAVSLALSGPRGLPAALSRRLPRPAPPARRLPDDRRLGGRARSPSSAAGHSRVRDAAPRRRRAARPVGRAAPGSTARFDGPYLRDELMELRRTSSRPWRPRTPGARSASSTRRWATRSAARWRPGHAGIVICHLSHAYADGASLYFTFIARARRAARRSSSGAQVKPAACEAIVAAGGTITHHHAVGRDHAPYMAAEVGELGLEALRAVKERLDPAGIMNPGQAAALAWPRYCSSVACVRARGAPCVRSAWPGRPSTSPISGAAPTKGPVILPRMTSVAGVGGFRLVRRRSRLPRSGSASEVRDDVDFVEGTAGDQEEHRGGDLEPGSEVARVSGPVAVPPEASPLAGVG